MKKNVFIAVLFSLFVLNYSFNSAQAEFISQTFTLKPGWNAVFLELEPESTDPADVFAEVANLQSVCRWNPKTSTVEFIQDPDLPVPLGSEWLVYYPGNTLLTNLYAIHAETPYLINLDGTSNVTWTVTGGPALPHIDWKANSFNFAGFHLTPGEEPYFDDFFSSSPAH